MVSASSKEEYRKGIAALKYNKAAGIDDVLVEQLKNLGPRAHKWLQTMLSKCLTYNNIQKLRKSYRPISLLCHTYKLYELMILNRVTPKLKQHLIKDQSDYY